MKSNEHEGHWGSWRIGDLMWRTYVHWRSSPCRTLCGSILFFVSHRMKTSGADFSSQPDLPPDGCAADAGATQGKSNCLKKQYRLFGPQKLCHHRCVRQECVHKWIFCLMLPILTCFPDSPDTIVYSTSRIWHTGDLSQWVVIITSQYMTKQLSSALHVDLIEQTDFPRNGFRHCLCSACETRGASMCLPSRGIDCIDAGVRKTLIRGQTQLKAYHSSSLNCLNLSKEFWFRHLSGFLSGLLCYKASHEGKMPRSHWGTQTMLENSETKRNRGATWDTVRHTTVYRQYLFPKSFTETMHKIHLHQQHEHQET